MAFFSQSGQARKVAKLAKGKADRAIFPFRALSLLIRRLMIQHPWHRSPPISVPSVFISGPFFSTDTESAVRACEFFCQKRTWSLYLPIMDPKRFDWSHLGIVR